jgi:threonine/homoserine/homoserine lactone efflux protein
MMVAVAALSLLVCTALLVVLLAQSLASDPWLTLGFLWLLWLGLRAIWRGVAASDG